MTLRQVVYSTAALCAGQVFAQTVPANPELMPFRYVITNITVRSRGRVVINDDFKAKKAFAPGSLLGQAAPGINYKVSLGKLGTADTKTGKLVITQANTIPFWNGYIAMITLPAGPNGEYTFTEQDAPLELSATVANPKPGPADHLIIGFIDTKNLHAEIGRLSCTETV